MYRVAKADANGVTSGGSGDQLSRRFLLVVSPDETVSECLVHAIEREFPSLKFNQVPSLEAACGAFEHPVSLILVDAAYLDKIDLHANDLARFHPSAPVALMQNDSRTSVSVKDVFASKIVRGVLPMDLKLDVWLSVIRLMLRGGEYIPISLLQSFVKDAPLRPDQAEWSAPSQKWADGGMDGLEELTDRELQILEMVARGLQNKIIAASLRLSEYTVKIHLHHIITKLGAHNRTEAAAIFHERRDAFQGAGQRSRASRAYSTPA